MTFTGLLRRLPIIAEHRSFAATSLDRILCCSEGVVGIFSQVVVAHWNSPSSSARTCAVGGYRFGNHHLNLIPLKECKFTP